MKMLLWITGTVSVLFTQSSPDTLWTKAIGGPLSDGSYSIQQTSDSGYIITGWTYPDIYDNDLILIKLTHNGEIQWEKTFGGNGHDIGYSVKQTRDGGYIIAGETSSFGNGFQVYLLKTDSNGNPIWQKTFGEIYQDGARSVLQLDDEGYIIAGLTDLSGFGNFDAYIIRTDSTGNLVWEKTYGGNNAEWIEEIQETNDSGFILVGRTYVSGNGDIYLIKTTNNGETLWTKTYGGANEDYGFSVQQVHNGYIITGHTSSYGAGGYDFYLVKTDLVGNILWQKTFGGADDDYAYSVQQTSDSGYIIVGSSLSFGTGLTDIYIVKTDSTGNFLWDKTLGGTYDDQGFAIQQTSDLGYIITGNTTSFGPGTPQSSNIYVVRLGTELKVGEYTLKDNPRILRNKILLKFNKLKNNLLYIALYEISGRKILENRHHLTNLITIPTNQVKTFKSGTYFLIILSKDMRTEKFKLILFK